MKINAELNTFDVHQHNLSANKAGPNLDNGRLTEIEIFTTDQIFLETATLNIGAIETDLVSDYHSFEVDTALMELQNAIWKNEFVGWKDDGDPMRFFSPHNELLN